MVNAPLLRGRGGVTADRLNSRKGISEGDISGRLVVVDVLSPDAEQIDLVASTLEAVGSVPVLRRVRDGSREHREGAIERSLWSPPGIEKLGRLGQTRARLDERGHVVTYLNVRQGHRRKLPVCTPGPPV